MKTRRIWGISCIVLGAVLLLFSYYIGEQVAQGKMQIRQGKSVLKSAESVFGMSDYTKPVGETLTSSGREKISAGEKDITKYSKMARNLKVGGIIFIIIGLGLSFIGKVRN